MALNDNKGLFWNSQGGDRKYNADSMEKWLKKFFTTGVYFEDCEVTAAGGMKVSVDVGYININGKTLLLEEATELTVPIAHSTSPRIDTVVVERNDNDRQFYLKIVEGTAEAEPEPTAPVRTDTVYQLVLAEIYVASGASAITAADITDKRYDGEVCGIIQNTLNTFSFGTEPLVAGESDLATGTFYFQYED